MKTNKAFMFSIVILFTAVSCSDFNPLEAGGIGNIRIYWNESYGSIYRANTDGTDLEKVLDTGLASCYFKSVALDKRNNRLFFAKDNDGSEAYIYRANLDGTGVEQIIDANAGAYSIYNMELDFVNNYIYWCGSGSAIYKCSMNGGTRENILTTANPSYDIALDIQNGYIYYTDGNNIKRGLINDPGNAENIFISDLSYPPRRIFLDTRNGMILWIDRNESTLDCRVFKANINGTSQEELYSTAIFIGGNDFVGDSFEQKVYWIEDNEIRQLDYGINSSADTVLTSSSGTNGLFLDLLP